MPTRLKTDKLGKYYQWGESGKKYYIKEYGKKEAKNKADKQGKAIYSSGYKGKSRSVKKKKTNF